MAFAVALVIAARVHVLRGGASGGGARTTGYRTRRTTQLFSAAHTLERGFSIISVLELHRHSENCDGYSGM